MLAHEGVKNKSNVNEKRQRNQTHQRHGGGHRLPPPTTKIPQFNLNQIQQRRHQKSAPKNRPDRRRHHPHAQPRRVGHTVVAAADSSNRLFQRQGDQAGEEEAAEGVHVAGNETLGDGGGGGTVAVLVFGEEVGGGIGGGVPGDAEEDGEGEEGIDIDDAVKGHDVDTGGGGAPLWNAGHGGGGGGGDGGAESRQRNEKKKKIITFLVGVVLVLVVKLSFLESN